MKGKLAFVRRAGFTVAALAAIAVTYTVAQHPLHSEPSRAAGRRVLYYVDPMHPAFRSDKPGISPDCGMPLEPVFADDAGKPVNTEIPAPMPDGSVHIDGATQRLVGIRIAPAERSTITHIIRAVGRVTPEDTRVYRVNAGVDGFIRETYRDSVGEFVRKDQKLASYYAPDFLAAASGFLAANERVPGSVTKEGARSIQNYTDRLKNLGMSDVQIQQMLASRQLPTSIDVVAPADGFILARNISPGQHFTHEMDFYVIADLSRVWISAEIEEQEEQFLYAGELGQLTLRGEGRSFTARISDSLPESEAHGGTVKLRLEADNPKFMLRPDMLVDVALPVHLAASITVPLDALVDSGEHKRVYVQCDGDTFAPREVVTGWSSGERVQILRGLQPGERVIASATFLVDSESRLKAPDPRSPAGRFAAGGKGGAQ